MEVGLALNCAVNPTFYLILIEGLANECAISCHPVFCPEGFDRGFDDYFIDREAKMAVIFLDATDGGIAKVDGLGVLEFEFHFYFSIRGFV